MESFTLYLKNSNFIRTPFKTDIAKSTFCLQDCVILCLHFKTKTKITLFKVTTVQFSQTGNSEVVAWSFLPDKPNYLNCFAIGSGCRFRSEMI